MDSESSASVLIEKPLVQEEALVQGTAIHHNVMFYPSPQHNPVVYVANQTHHVKCHDLSQTAEVVKSSPDLPISLATLTKATSIMMATILLSCGYQACQSGEYTCNLHDFPDVSHVMGVAPLNKLYAMMLTWYSFNKLNYYRAFH